MRAVPGSHRVPLRPRLVEFGSAMPPQPDEIRMEADGTVTFLRLTGSMSMPARVIRRVQGVRAADYDGDVSWHMQVWTLGETFTVDFFERAMEFVGDLRAMNPSLLVDGEWPVLNPWDPRLRSNGAHLDQG